MPHFLRESVIGMLIARMSARAGAGELSVPFSTISCLQRRFREFGSTSNQPHNHRPSVTTPAQDLYLRHPNLQDHLWLATRTAAATIGLHNQIISVQTTWVGKCIQCLNEGWILTFNQLLTFCITIWEKNNTGDQLDRNLVPTKQSLACYLAIVCIVEYVVSVAGWTATLNCPVEWVFCCSICYKFNDANTNRRTRGRFISSS